MENAMNEFDALLGMGITDEEQLKALSESLRGKKRAADFFAVTQIPQIQKAAQAEQKAILGSAEQAGVLKRALDERRLKESEGEKNRESALLRTAMMAQSRDGGSGGASRYMHVDTVRLPDGRRVKAGLNPKTNQYEVMPGQDDFGIDPLTEGQIGSLMERSYARLKPTLELTGAVDNLVSVLKPFSGEDSNPRKIPGLGPVEKAPVIGDVARFAQDVATGTGEQGKVYSAVRKVMNTIIRNQAGLTQTKQELTNVTRETGMDALSDPQVFVANLDTIMDALEADVRRQYGTMHPEIRSRIANDFEMLGQENPFTKNFERLTFGATPKGFGSLVSDVADSVDLSAEEQTPVADDYLDFENMSDEELEAWIMENE